MTGGLMVGCGISEEEQAMIENYSKLDQQVKVDEAQPWFTMKESEKVVMENEVKKNGIYFNAENKTDVVLTVQADSVSVNGISSNNIMMSDDISPKSKGVIHA